MHFSIVVFFAASLASAFTIFKRQTDAPACAQTCYTAANPSPCTNTDVPCLCLNPNFLTELDICTENTCTPEELDAAYAWGQATCQQAGVNLQDPFPACAQTCVQNAPLGACEDGDDVCLCKDPNYTQSVANCVSTSCTGQDITNANTVAQAYCRAASADVATTATA